MTAESVRAGVGRGATWIRSSLPAVVGLLLVAAWWLSLIVVLDTPLVNVTPPKLIAFAVVPALLMARPWRLVTRADAPLILLLAVLVSWLLVAALVRQSAADIKLTAGYAVFLASAAALGYAAARARPDASARVLVAVVLAAVFVTLATGLLERVTYVGPDGPDPLEPLWSFVRPQGGLASDPESTAGLQPLHFPSGDLSIPRVASLFAHVNYLAFFGFLTAALSATLLLASLSTSARGTSIVAAFGLVASTLATAWTYSRAGLIGLVGIAIAAPLVAVLTGKGPDRRRAVLLGAPLLLVIATLGANLAFDEVGLRRFAPVVADPPLAEGPPPSVTEEPSIEVSAARSGHIRFALQANALDMVTADPVSFVLGPGMTAFANAIGDPAAERYVPGAEGIVDPNSLWLTMALAGGSVAVIALAALIAGTEIRLLGAARKHPPGRRQWVLSWLAAWLPVWSMVQFVGTNPFNTSEAMILGTLLGTGVGLSGVTQGSVVAPRD